MNVAPTITTLQTPSAKGDPTSAASTTTRMVPDGSGTDLPVDATQGDTFGRMLSRGMAGLDEVLQGKSVKPLSLPTEPGVAPGDDAASDASAARAAPIDRSRGFGVAVTDLVDAEATTARSTKKVDDGTEDAPAVLDGGRHDDAAANDLAAQLALVSQWAGIAKPPVAQGAQASSGLAIQDKLATVRGTASTTAAPSTSRTAPSQVGASVADQPEDASTLPFAGGSRQVSVKDERDIDVGSTSTTTKKTDPVIARTVDTAQSAALAAASVEPGAVRTPSESVVAPLDAFVQQIAAATTASTAPTADVAAVPSWNIHEQVGTPAWSREVGQATLRIATGDLQSASLQINPEHLGPVDVQVRIDNGIAHLSFTAAHADTRQAIESSRATLDRLFADQGLKVGDCAVGDSSTARRNPDADAALSGQSQRNGGGRWDQAAGTGNAAADAGPATTITTRLKALGLVDTFA